MSDIYDLTIVGGGPGGYVAAIRAAQLGLKVALVEKDKALGGTCLHRGCIPTKALLHYTEMVEKLAHCADFGVNAALSSIDVPKMHAAKAKVVKRMAMGIDGLMKKNGITVKTGSGRLLSPGTLSDPGQSFGQVEVNGEIITSSRVLLATGSKPATLPFLPPDGKQVFTSDEILTYTGVPKSLVVLGAGAVGLEFACVYNALGSQVQVVEMADRPLPLEDEDVSREVATAFKKRGITIYCANRLTGAEISGRGVRLRGENMANGGPVSFQADAVLCAVGRLPVLDGLGLEDLGVEMEGRYVKVDPQYRTNLWWLYAIGDIVPGPQLAHVASAEGIVCVEAIAGHPNHPIDYEKIPSATYCRPEVASVGLTETQARDRGYEVLIGQFPWAALAKANILGQPDGFVKIVSEARYGELLGVHIVGPHATDLIAEACVAINCEATVEELFRTVHAHPTLPEGLMEAAHGVFGHPLHLPPQRARKKSGAPEALTPV
jgi:dihydrolipoamide dehydrogenase